MQSIASYFRWNVAASVVALLIGCGGGGGGSGSSAPSLPNSAWFSDVTSTHLDPAVVGLACMDAQAVDLDSDNDLDLVLAIEYHQNVVLRNDGTGNFQSVSGAVGMISNREDHEDLVAGDFDGDGDIDLAFAAEETAVHEIYINQGSMFMGYQLGAGSVANTVAAVDFDHDSDLDLIFAGQGMLIMQNDGLANFSVYSGDRIPAALGVVQDMAVADVDGDGDLDLMLGVEGRNQLFLNSGSGWYDDVSSSHLVNVIDETRVVKFADFDRDGNLDLFVGNVLQEMIGIPASNYIYLNDGQGHFLTAISASVGASTYGNALVDFDSDGDVDVVNANADLLNGSNVLSFTIYRNHAGGFTDSTTDAFGGSIKEHGFGVAAGDFNKDGKTDLYLCSRGAVSSGSRVGARDHLLFGVE